MSGPMISMRDADSPAKSAGMAAFAMGFSLGGCTGDVLTRLQLKARAEEEAAIRAEARREGRAEAVEALRAGGAK